MALLAWSRDDYMSWINVGEDGFAPFKEGLG
jgi:hypothetical protein